ncbi:MAG: hypothetical protein LC105_11850 [Chitinophagales bacterium]|nr:hypothetical protein [Chitinophagales bacterium]
MATSCNKAIVEECQVLNLKAIPLSCSSDSTYSLKISFDHLFADNKYFDVFIRNDQHIGFYQLDDIPIIITDFKKSGNKYDFIKVCVNDNPDCCEVIEFLPPTCETEKCSITNLQVDKGECNSDSTYSLTLNFEASNPTNSYFDVFVRENKNIGYFELSDLPITIPHFKMSGKEYDFIKVCVNDNPDCCEVIEFLPPTCETEKCSITNLQVDKGECNSDSTYSLTLNFEASNPTNSYFDVFVRENKNIGYFKLSDLPITIPHFKISGKEYDFIKVCVNDNPDCCEVIEFLSNDCK